MSRFAFVIPSIHPDEFDEFIYGSLQHISNLRGRAAFALCCQSPWTVDSAIEAKKKVEDAGFECRIAMSDSIRHPEVAPSMTRLRQEAALLFPGVDYYCFGDDNMEFSPGTKQFPRSSGERYDEVLDYMDDYKKCGVVCCVGALGGMPQQYKIKPTTIGLIATSRGLFLRNTIETCGVFLNEVVGLSGGLEETAASYPIVASGYYAAKQFFNPTLLRNVHKLTENQPPDSIHNSKVIAENVQHWVRTRWNDGSWTHDGRKFPVKLHTEFEVHFGASMKSVAECHHFVKDYK
jgi:hypothetical protein